MPEPIQICLVSPGHLGSNPRLVKEADALAAAGYQVHVIAGDSLPAIRVRDAAILARAKWSATILPFRPGRVVYICRRLAQLLCRRLFAWGITHPAVARRAHHLLVPALTKAACATRADLYIGHCLAALPAVVQAGARRQVPIGFDAEDFHSAEVADEGEGRLDNAIVRALERDLLPRCQHLTASSPLITAAYLDEFGVKALTLLNVFPLAEAVEPLPAPPTPAFYWFSQTIGPGRGLEQFIDILCRLGCPVRLDLRGLVTDAYAKTLHTLADGRVELRLLAPAAPDTMVANAAGYTLGLALELTSPRNRDMCITNKAFTYLLAGIPVVFSNTSAQARLAAELGAAALLVDLANPGASAQILQAWLGDPAARAQARRAAFEFGRGRYNWDLEQVAFLTQIKRVLQR